jgi:hypothetical protein
MRFQILIFCTILSFSILLTGCPSGEQPPANADANANRTSVSDPNRPSNSALNTSKAPVEATTNDAPTLKPAFTAYCDAMTKMDEAALRKVFSAATLKAHEANAKEEKSSLAEYLKADRVSNKLCEIRNEKIEGDTAVAEVKTEGAPNGFKMKFVRENGEWKITNESPEFDAVKRSAEDSNAAR